MTIRSVLAQSELDELTNLLRSGELTAWDFGRAAIILAVAIVAARLARFVLARGLARRRTDTILGDLAGRILSYLIVMFGCIYALEALGVAIGPLLGALGIVGFALAFALQDVVENFVAGVINSPEIGTAPIGLPRSNDKMCSRKAVFHAIATGSRNLGTGINVKWSNSLSKF
jgi:small-conductance mechanosensitive channel